MQLLCGLVIKITLCVVTTVEMLENEAVKAEVLAFPSFIYFLHSSQCVLMHI